MIPTDSEQTIETIAHFAGQWHLHVELGRSREIYDGAAHRAPNDDFVGKRVRDPGPADADDSTAGRSSPLPEQYDTVIDWFDPAVVLSARISPVALSKSLPPVQPLPVAPAAVPGSGGAGADGDDGGVLRFLKRFAPVAKEPPITVSYDETVDQRLLLNKQLNQLVDYDQLIVNSQGGLDGQLHTDVVKTLGEMLAKAEEAVPEDLIPPPGDASDLVQFVVAHQTAASDEEPAGDGGAGAGVAAKVGDGLYIDGELQSSTAKHDLVDLPERPDIDLPTTAGSIGLSAEIGGNTGFNLAQIIDLNEAATTVVVQGDHMVTNAILQVNVYRDVDQVEAAGPHLQTGDQENTATNIAEFKSDPVFEGPIPKIFAGPKWHVDKLDGDFYDVKVTAQINMMFDGDTVVHTTEDSFSRIVTGGTVQMNVSSWADLASVYDLIIVGGDLHEANFIVQKNLMIDDDVLKVVSAADGEQQASMAVSWKGNLLLNDATIQNYGAEATDGIPDDVAKVVTAIQAGETDLGSDYGWYLPGSSSDTFNVLYITGNCYDINVIAQINVMADLDTAVQYMPDIKAPNEDGVQQSASTGGNTVVNTATIVDVGATAQFYVAGNSYEESILIQANIVANEGDEDQLKFGDTETLATEVIAFTDDDDCPEDGPAPEPVKDFAAHDDFVGSVMH